MFTRSRAPTLLYGRLEVVPDATEGDSRTAPTRPPLGVSPQPALVSPPVASSNDDQQVVLLTRATR